MRDYLDVLLGESEIRCKFNLFQSFNSIDRFLCTLTFLHWSELYVFLTFLENNNNDNNKAGLLCSRFFFVCRTDTKKGCKGD